MRIPNGSMELRPTKIICLLRSYAAHAEEMKNEVPDRPTFFLKPPSSLLGNGGEIVIPEGVNELHHEIELAMIIGRGGKNIPQERAMDHISYFLPMLDITARDLQSAAKKKGLPWSESKGYDTFAPVGPEAIPAKDFNWRGRRIWLEVNGGARQDSSTDLLVYPLERIVSDISNVMSLENGDIIMTGTPEGVGPLVEGDVVEAGIEGMASLKFTVVKGLRPQR
ncbi:MAG: fumarylacetoacetate hydrolase family protein [Thermoplasmatota archaeon]